MYLLQTPTQKVHKDTRIPVICESVMSKANEPNITEVTTVPKSIKISNEKINTFFVKLNTPLQKFLFIFENL
jgi:hypothetical protein